MALAYLLILMAGALTGAAAAYLFCSRTALADKQDTNWHGAVLGASDAGYLYLRFSDNREEPSSQLRHLFNLSGLGPVLAAIESALEPGSAQVLKNAIEELKRSTRQVLFHIADGEGQRHFECCAGSVAGAGGAVNEIVIWFHEISGAQKQYTRLARENEKLKHDLKNALDILNLLPVPVWQRDASLAIRYCNLAYSQITEEGPDKVMEIEEMELHRQAKHLAQAVMEAGVMKTERRHIIAGGQRRLFQISEIPMQGEQILVGMAQDFTALENVQEQLQQYVTAQKDLLETSVSATAIFGADTRLKFFNYAFVRLWGLDEAWLGTQPTYGEFLEVLREKRRLPEQANFPLFKQQHLKIFKDLLAPHEEFFYLPDGKTLRVIAVPHALGGVIFAYEDVTDRLALERSYNTLIAVQKATLDNLHEAIVVFGEDGRLRLFNPAFTRLWKLEDRPIAHGMHISELLELTHGMHSDLDWATAKKKMIGRLYDRKIQQYREERPDGSVVDALWIPLPDGATLVSFYDVTDSTLVERSLREKNDALQDADRLKSEFLANVSYELRSPLTSIQGFAEMLSNNYLGPLAVKQQDYVLNIRESAGYLKELIDDILDVASMEAGYMQLDPREFSVQAMLMAVKGLVAERAKEQGKKLSVECDKAIGTMVADENRIRQVILHLLGNALKFTAKKGKITLGARYDSAADAIAIWVEDDGAGIPKEEQEKVFAKFYRGKSSGPRSGTGLGLAIVRSVVELHGGRVFLDSELGKGTRVECVFPRRSVEQRKNVA